MTQFSYFILHSNSLCLNFFFAYLPESQILKIFLFIQTNSFKNSLVQIQFYLYRASDKWVSEKTAVITRHVNSQHTVYTMEPTNQCSSCNLFY